MADTWKVIVSSMSGGGKASSEWPEIAERLEARGIAYSVSFTKYRFHALEIAKGLERGLRIIVIGGDGALHEVLSVYVTSKFLQSGNTCYFCWFGK